MNNIILQTNDFNVIVPDVPHVDRNEGGHIYIQCRNPDYSSLTDLPSDVACKLIILTQAVGNAMMAALRADNIDIQMINYQINGNWSAKKVKRDPMHMHLYGRATTAEIQPFGEALRFQLPSTGCYDELTPLNSRDIQFILDYLSTHFTF